MAQTICVDASFVVRLVTSSSETSPFMVLWEQWQSENASIIAPSLLDYEVTNVFHRLRRAEEISSEEAEASLRDALSLNIDLYGDRQLHEEALALAQKLSLPATYDAHYLALAQRFEANFYTADKKLFNSVKDLLTWIKLVA